MNQVRIDVARKNASRAHRKEQSSRSEQTLPSAAPHLSLAKICAIRHTPYHPNRMRRKLVYNHRYSSLSDTAGG